MSLRLSRLVIIMLLVGLWAALPAPSTRAAGAPLTLRILHTNDHHSSLEPRLVDGQERGGIARRKTLVDALRGESAARAEPTLLLDAGDVFQGSPYFERYRGQADLAFYNALAYDAMTIGNHEFDLGDQALADFIAGARFPVLSANVTAVAPSPLAGRILPWTILERDGRRIGVFGLTTIERPWLSASGPGVSFGDPLAAARRSVRELEAQGVSVIIALSHLGTTEDLLLLQQVPGIDIMIGGHSHTSRGEPRTTAPYPALITLSDGSRAAYGIAWAYGIMLGDLVVTLDPQGNVLQAGGQLHLLDRSVTPDPTFAEQAANYARGLQP